MTREKIYEILSKIEAGQSVSKKEFAEFSAIKVNLNDYMASLDEKYGIIHKQNGYFRVSTIKPCFVWVYDNDATVKYYLANTRTIVTGGEMSIADIFLSNDYSQVLPFYYNFPQAVDVALDLVKSKQLSEKQAREEIEKLARRKIIGVVKRFGLSDGLVKNVLSLDERQLEGLKQIIEIQQENNNSTVKSKNPSSSGQMGE